MFVARKGHRISIGAVVAVIAALVAFSAPPALAATPSHPLVGTVSNIKAVALTTPTPPQDDPFYTPPAGYSKKAPGTVLRSRQIELATFATLPQDDQAWQLLFRTTDYQGHAEATVTTVILPSGQAARGVVSYQVAEDAVAPQCAPSYELQAGSGTGGTFNQAELLLIDATVEQGFAVSIPDFEGPNGDFGAVKQPGYAILDGIRAAEHFAPLGLQGAATPAGLWGYSGGSLASGWAAQVQPTYAPELNLRGVAVGGYITDIVQAMEQVNGGFGAGLLVSVLSGVAQTVPALSAALDKYATPAGKALFATGASQCESTNVTDYAFTNLNSYLTISFDQLMALPSVSAAMAKLSLGGSTPTAPLFVYHAVNDELVPISGPDATVAKYCSTGGNVTYVRDLASEHLTLMFAGAPAALDWLTDRLTGTSTSAGCTTTTVPTITLTPGELQELPPFLVGAVNGILDQPIGLDEVG